MPPSQFEIKFYTRAQFRDIIDYEFQLPNLNEHDRLSLNYAIGEVRYDSVEESVIIKWNPIRENTMAKSLGKNILTHDNTSFTIFSSLIKHIQSLFFSNILTEESFKLSRMAQYEDFDANVFFENTNTPLIVKNEQQQQQQLPNVDDNLGYNTFMANMPPQTANESEHFNNSVVMKHNTRRELKYMYGRIVLPLIYYIFTLKPKLDLKLLNTFYKNDQEIAAINDAATAAPRETTVPYFQTPVYPTAPFPTPATLINETLTPIIPQFPPDYQLDEDTIMKTLQNYDAELENKRTIPRDATSLVGPPPLTGALSSSMISAPPLVQSSPDHSSCTIRMKRKTKQLHHNSGTKAKKRLFEYNARFTDEEDTYDSYTSDSYSDESGRCSAPPESTLFEGRFKNLKITQESMLAMIDKFSKYFLIGEQRQHLDQVAMKRDWRYVQAQFKNFKNELNISDEDLQSNMQKIYTTFGHQHKKEYYNQLYNEARLNNDYAVMMLYLYVDYHLKQLQ